MSALKLIDWATCTGCGQEFPQTQGHRGRPRSYCRDCRAAGSAAYNRVYRARHPQPQQPGRPVPCGYCGETIHLRPNDRRLYCSRQCKEDARKKRNATIEVVCANCGCQFMRSKRAYRKREHEGKPHYCSRPCWRQVAAPPIKRGPRRQKNETTGYIRIAGYGAEHRFVMEQHLGRPLRIGEVVHHRNGDRADNRIANLELWVRPHPSGQRREDLVEAGRDAEREAITAVLADHGLALAFNDGVYTLERGGAS